MRRHESLGEMEIVHYTSLAEQGSQARAGLGETHARNNMYQIQADLPPNAH